MESDTVDFGVNRTWQLTSLYEDSPAGVVWRSRAREGKPESALIASPAYVVGGQGQKRLTADAAVWQNLADRRLPGIAVALYDWGMEPKPFMVLDPPVGTALEELAAGEGPLPEREALVCIRRVAALLQILHDDLDCALAPSALQQACWDRKTELLWLPLWHELAHAPTSQRRAFDLGQVGVLLHGLLLGRPALHLWGQPVLLDEQPAADGPASRGAWRLLRRLLHPNPARRLTSAAALVAEIEHLLHAWDDQPSVLLDEAEHLFQKAETGAPEQAWQAEALLAVLARRTPDLPDLDWMQADVAALVAHQQTIETALQLARGRSLAPAVDKLRRTAADNDDRLVLARWAAVLGTPDIDQVLVDDRASQHLRVAVEALQRGDLAAAQAALAAMPQAPPSLAVEVVVRLAWLDAASQASNPTALLALDQSSTALEAIADANLRTALDDALGGLARWRQIAAAYQSTAADAARKNERIARLRSLRQERCWMDACSELRTALAMDPADRALAKEARLLGMEVLLAGQQEAAAEAFALATADPTERRLAQIGWRVARALAALQADPLGDASLAQAQLAVARCRALTAQTIDAAEPLQQLTHALEKGLEQAAAAAARISSAEGRRAAQALTGTLRRLTYGEDPRATRPDALQILDHAIEQALAADAQATHALLTQRLGSAPIPRSAPVEKPLPPPPTPAQIDQMMQRLISPHFHEMAAALDEVSSGALGEVGAAKLASLVKEAQQAIDQHKSAMNKVVWLASQGENVQAERVLRDATRGHRSHTCWYPADSRWVATEWLLARVDPIREALNSDDPRRWEQVIKTPSDERLTWTPSVTQKAHQRANEISKHRTDMDRVLSDLDRDPVKAKENLEKWRQGHPRWSCCWDPRKKEWVEVETLEREVKSAADTSQAQKWLQQAQLLQKRGKPPSKVKEAAASGMAFTQADPAVIRQLDDLRQNLTGATQSAPGSRPLPAATRPTTDAMPPSAHPPDSLHALLERPIRESKTLTELRQRIQGLLLTNKTHEDVLKGQHGSLRVWEGEEQWLTSIENMRLKSEHAKSHAAQALRNLDALTAQKFWRPYIPANGPTVFDKTRNRLQAVASRHVIAPHLEVPQTATNPAVPGIGLSVAKAPLNGKDNNARIRLEMDLERHLRGTNSLIILEKKIQALQLTHKDYEAELTSLVGKIAELRQEASFLDEILSLSGEPPRVEDVRRAAQISAEIAALPLPTRPKALVDLDRKAKTVATLLRPYSGT